MKQDFNCGIYDYISCILCMRKWETLLLLVIHNNTNRGPLTFEIKPNYFRLGLW